MDDQSAYFFMLHTHSTLQEKVFIIYEYFLLFTYTFRLTVRDLLQWKIYINHKLFMFPNVKWSYFFRTRLLSSSIYGKGQCDLQRRDAGTPSHFTMSRSCTITSS